MSRTRRIKKYHPCRGKTTYAVGEWVSYWVYHPVQTRPSLYFGGIEVKYQPRSWRHEWVPIDPSDRKKYRKALAKRHSESSHANERSPGHWYRRRRETEYRRFSDREIHRFMRNPEHEVIIHRKPKSHLWDWR